MIKSLRQICSQHFRESVDWINQKKLNELDNYNLTSISHIEYKLELLYIITKIYLQHSIFFKYVGQSLSEDGSSQIKIGKVA